MVLKDYIKDEKNFFKPPIYQLQGVALSPWYKTAENVFHWSVCFLGSISF